MTASLLRSTLALTGALMVASCAGPSLQVVRSGDSPGAAPASLTETPEVREVDASDDFLEHAVRRPLRYVLVPPRAFRDWLGRKVEAYNPTAADDVVDSSWFTHRNSRRRMTPAEIARGPVAAGRALWRWPGRRARIAH